MTLMMTSAQVVETSVNVTNNSPSWDYSHPEGQTTEMLVYLVTMYTGKCNLLVTRPLFKCFQRLRLTITIRVVFQRIRHIGGLITTSECTLFMLLGDAKHPNFREVQALVKTAAPDTGLLSKV